MLDFVHHHCYKSSFSSRSIFCHKNKCSALLWFNFFLTLLCCMCPSCVVCHTKLTCSICNLWSLPRDVCRGTTTVITCKHRSSWSIHGNCSLCWHGNCSCPGMATAVVPPWQLQLSREGNNSCPGMTTAVIYWWQLQLSSHGNCSCQLCSFC